MRDWVYLSIIGFLVMLVLLQESLGSIKSHKSYREGLIAGQLDMAQSIIDGRKHGI